MLYFEKAGKVLAHGLTWEEMRISPNSVCFGFHYIQHIDSGWKATREVQPVQDLLEVAVAMTYDRSFSSQKVVNQKVSASCSALASSLVVKNMALPVTIAVMVKRRLTMGVIAVVPPILDTLWSWVCSQNSSSNE